MRSVDAGGLHRHEFATSDPDTAEESIRGSYVDTKLTINGEDFTFGHSAVTAPGFSINMMHIGIDFAVDAESTPDDALTIVQLARGRLACGRCACVAASTDAVALAENLRADDDRWLAHLGGAHPLRLHGSPEHVEASTGRITKETLTRDLPGPFARIVDLDVRLVPIEHMIIRMKSTGLVRRTTKSLAGERTSRLPDFAMGMLRRRRLTSESAGPSARQLADSSGTPRCP